MFPKRTFIVIQIIAFIIVSLAASTIIVCFPNPPAMLRGFFNEYRVNLQDKNAANNPIDKRFLKWFNRDPDRKIPQEPRIVVSPADGILEQIIKKDGRIHLIIEMRYTDVHVQRVPMTGKVIGISGGGEKLKEGFRVMDYELDKMMPFQKVTTFETSIGTFRVRQITSFFAKRITVFLKVGKRYDRGARLGNVLAGSTIVLDLPNCVKIVVKKNSKVLAGETIVGRY